MNYLYSSFLQRKWGLGDLGTWGLGDLGTGRLGEINIIIQTPNSHHYLLTD